MNAQALMNTFGSEGISFFCGVPDTILAGFVKCIDNQCLRNVVTANEGNAIGVATGYYLSTGEIACVYMSSAGLGNCVNPLTSLTNKEMYNVPMVLLIGLRDEPAQHSLMKKAIAGILENIDIKWWVIGELKDAISWSRLNNRPVAVIINENVECCVDDAPNPVYVGLMTRQEVIQVIISVVSEDDVIVCSTGKACRELNELTCKNPKFLNVGAMGHASSIALGIAMNTTKQVVCIDGDGSILMHAGSLATIGGTCPVNFKHVIINNGLHDSIGSVRLTNDLLSFDELSKNFDYNYSEWAICDNKKHLITLVKELMAAEGPALLDLHVKPGARDDLSRPTESFGELKEEFMKRCQA